LQCLLLLLLPPHLCLLTAEPFEVFYGLNREDGVRKTQRKSGRERERRANRAMAWHLHVHVLAAFVGVVVVL